jgi:hypothetical protein
MRVTSQMFLPGDGDGQGFGAQPFAAAGGAGAHAHVFFQLDADILAGRLLVAPLQVGDHAAKGRLVEAFLALAVRVVDAHLLALVRCAVEMMSRCLRLNSFTGAERGCLYCLQTARSTWR